MRFMPVSTSLCSRLMLVLCALMLQACATSSALTVAREQFRSGNADVALEMLKEAEVSRRDELLLLLDTAMVAQAAGRYRESTASFERAYLLSKELDYLSIRDQSAAIATSDWALRYGGEYSERLWIHTFQMINYLMLDEPTGAAVEARRAVELYDTYSDVLDSDLFTRVLMAISFEAAGQQDSASVEYRKLASLMGSEKPWQARTSRRQLLLMIASGFIEPKLPGDLLVDIDARIAFPYYPEIYERRPDITVSSGGRILQTSRMDTKLLAVASGALAKRGKAIAARQAIRLAAKYQLAENIEEKDPLAGGLVKLFLLVIEQADTRSWETLPAYLSLVKVDIPDDAASVNIDVNSLGNTPAYYRTNGVRIDLSDSKTQFHMIRAGIKRDPLPMVSP